MNKLDARSKTTTDLTKLKDKIENKNGLDELEIAIIACYIPLNASKIITNKLLTHNSEKVLFNDLIDVQIHEPLKELELKKSIVSFEKIHDPVSKKVREQYEEHPYPRWRFTNKSLTSNFLSWLNSEIKPNRVVYNNNFDNPNVLMCWLWNWISFNLVNTHRVFRSWGKLNKFSLCQKKNR